MSVWMDPDSDRDMGCWGCLGFLKKPFKPSDSFLDDEREFMMGEDWDGANGYSGRGCRKAAPLAGLNRAICREVPVKETTHLVRGEDADGCKTINEYVRECNIGRGSYGKVVLYRSNNDGKQYAIKAFYKSRLAKVRVTSSETAMSDVRREDIVHGDIKPENLLVTKSGIVKIGDFSVSHAFEEGDDVLGRSPGTPVFTAPECCLGPTYHGKAADVWAVGVTLYCMALGHCPYIGDSLQDTYEQIINKSLYLPEEMDPELKDLLEGLLCKDPRQRLTLEAAADHPWVVREEGPILRTSCRCKSFGLQEEERGGAYTDLGE